VATRKKTATTGLTEIQARALADWWGGRYERLIIPQGEGQACHGVILPASGQPGPARPASRETAIFSLEEALALEKIRDVNNPAAPDWVG
jgi:hypothetical protein